MTQILISGPILAHSFLQALSLLVASTSLYLSLLLQAII